MYTTAEKIDIVNWYVSENSLRTVRDLFSVKYPQRPIPCLQTITNIVNHFKNNGCLVRQHVRHRRQTTVLTEDIKLDILCYVEENPIRSLREMAAEFNVSVSSIRNTLKEFNYKSYKFQNHQELLENDKLRRTDFCETMFNLLNENQDILNKIVFTDEASFALNGTVNAQNYFNTE